MSAEIARTGAQSSSEGSPRTSPAAPPRQESPAGDDSVAALLGPLLGRMFSDGVPLRFEFWDGSVAGPPDSVGRAIVRSPEALKRIFWSPGELGVARAFVTGDLDVVTEEPAAGDGSSAGDIYTVLRALHEGMANRLPKASDTVLPLLAAAGRLRLLGAPLPPPAAEVRLSGKWRRRSLHSRERDAEAIRHHYDISNDFYRLVLGPAMTYSCAFFTTPESSLEDAQAAKHELVCRKLGLAERPGSRLLDVGCGWGSMALHAASRYDAEVTGVTLSTAQADLARKRVADAGLSDRIEIRAQDYRDIRGETFDAISSIGMFEHVGELKMAEYFSTLYRLLAPRGRFLNHAISSVNSSKLRGRTFMNRYVFPDSQLIDVARVVRGMEDVRLEVRDVESLREHYARTLRHWVSNLEAHFDEAVELVGAERARVWRLYMCASVNGFEDGGIAIHQVLGVKPDDRGASGMPLTRSSWA
ncbi:MAG: class I SAM-dependent methyltransferase [Acidimicrobiales bacterium]